MIIYKITNSINGKIYIGKDSKNNPNYFGSGMLLKKAIKKYGIENFTKEIIQTCENLIDLNEAEKYWIEFSNSTHREIGYNIAKGGDGGDTITHHPNKLEIRHKQSLSQMGNVISDANKKNATGARKKVHPSYGSNVDEKIKHDYNKAHSEYLKKYWTENTHPQKNKTLETFYGEQRANEIRKKMSESLSGEKHPNFNKKTKEDIKKKIGDSVSATKNPYCEILITSESGIETLVYSLKEAANFIKGNRTYIKKCLFNDNIKYKGYKFKLKS